jgi:hypothetical protein
MVAQLKPVSAVARHPALPAEQAPRRSAERAMLAAAIRHADEAARASSAARQAVERATDLAAKSVARLRAARGAVESEKERYVQVLMSAAATGTPASLAGEMREAMCEARADELAAADELDAAEAALAQLKSELVGASGVAEDAEDRRLAAVDSVMRSVAGPVLREARTLARSGPDQQDELLQHVLVLKFVSDPDNRPDSYAAREMGRGFAKVGREIREFLDEIGPLPGDGGTLGWRYHPRLEPWRRAYTDLYGDHEVPLPVPE